MQKLTMHTSRTYDVLMEEGLLASAADYIAELLPPFAGNGGDSAADAKRKCCIICDKTVYGLYGQSGKPLQNGLLDAGYEVGYYAFPPGEENKTLNIVDDICRFMPVILRRASKPNAITGAVSAAGFPKHRACRHDP